jgi:lysine 2,3-aminomutase
MAGTKTGEFKELVSPFLKTKIAEAIDRFGKDSPQATALTRQYIYDPLESAIRPDERRRHYESEVQLTFEGKPVVGVERLYRRTILLEPTTVCAAHCRWCLRGQYPVKTITPTELEIAARYIGSPELRGEVDEVLMTGGDPLMSVPLLERSLELLAEHAANIRIVRIGSRVPFQDPERIDDAMVEMFGRFPNFQFELGVNVNHPIEFWPETVAALKRLQRIGFRMYNQHPLLRGVNDDIDTLVALYEKLREIGIEAHYLFHAIPLRGMSHHRTSVERGLELATALNSCGSFSGRAKPRFAVLSDIGKIVLYHGSIVDRRASDNSLLLKSGFRLEDRLRWNPSWQMPASAVLANDGTLMTWYKDGGDEISALAPADVPRRRAIR